MKALLTFCLLSFASIVPAQNLVGYSDAEIRQYMKDNEKGFVFQNFTNNSTFRYLKYADKKETQTLLFFFNSDLECKMVRLVCDKNLKASKIREMDSKYNKDGENRWTEIRDGSTYLIELKEEDVTFNITIQKKE